MPEDLRVWLGAPEGARADSAVDVEPVVGDELVQVAAPVRDEADLDPVLAEHRERRQRVLVEREPLVLLPRADELGGAPGRALGRRRPSRARSPR